MKKLVLLLVSAMLMTLFIAFNYLLWDKEQNTQNIKTLESKNDNKEAMIDALGRDIKNLQESNREYSTQIKALENNNSNLQKRYDELLQNEQKNKELLERKNEIINVFKQQVDLMPLEGTIKKWVESIDKGQYETAYKLESQSFKDSGEIVSLSEYSEVYKKSVKSIKVKDIKVYNKEVEGTDNGDIIFLVILEVNKAEGAVHNQFSEGTNDKLFSITYDREKGGWIVSNIIPVPEKS